MKSLSRKTVWSVAFLLLLAFGFRLFVALRLPNDTPDDGRVYAQIARNVLEQHVYSHEEQPPFVPSLIRLPGYPMFLASVYALTRHGNTAVRIVQAIIDTGTCVLIALVAFQWVADQRRKRAAALAALGLAAVCPFTTIYVATILTEVPTSFFAVLLCLLTTLAFKTSNRRRANWFWLLAGVTAGLAVLFRPDSGLFAAAVGMTILLTSFCNAPPRQKIYNLGKSILSAAVFSFAFCLILVPWTIRNRRVFGVFQPLAPAHGEMPGEFVPHGYLMWLRTWLDDGRYVGPVLWRLDTAPISIQAFPAKAFDSEQERDRVAALMEKYNGNQEQQAGAESSDSEDKQPATTEDDKSTPADEGNDDNDASSDEEDSGADEQGGVEMTPEIDAAFAQLARERISRSPVRYYFLLPLKRARSLWFDTHSQYYPFEGDLLPLEDLNYQIHQQYWLPAFAGLTWIYTILGLMGAWLLLRSRKANSRRWVLLASLIIFLRLGFFASLENPEPRYTVEIFPFLAILGGLVFAFLLPVVRPADEKFLNSASN